MARFVIMVEWGPARDLEPELERAREVLTLGGSRESVFELQRPGLGAVLVTHESGSPALESGGAIILGGGHGLPDEDDVAFLAAMASWARTGEGPAPGLRRRPLGRRCLVRWDAGGRELLVVSEPNGLAPLYLRMDRDRVLLATEPKGIWAVAPDGLHVDADAIEDLFAVGECVDGRTLFREVTAVPPGTAWRLGPGRCTRRDWYAPRFSDDVGGDVRVAAEAMNSALLEILSAERRTSPCVTVALSGGMDSRYLLAGARQVWDRVETLTFGPPGSADVVRAREVARRAGVPHHEVPWSGAELSRWAPFAVWRTDGMQSCVHHHGMDALITRAATTGLVLNGMGGDVLTGAFLRPSYLLLPGDAARAAETVLARYRFHARAPREVFKPELLRERRSTTMASLTELLSRQPSRRLGNALLGFWLRQHCPRLTVLGLELEAPFVEYAAPLADPYFVEAVAPLSLEQRFLGRAYRRALGRLDRALMGVPCDRYGLAPRWPWPVLALSGSARRLRLARRTPSQASYTEGYRRPVLAWVRDLLLDRETLAEGFLLPAYLTSLVEAQAAGRADHTRELGMALALELWRRMFFAGRRELARPPIELPQPRAPQRSFGSGTPLPSGPDPAGREGTRA